jgi:hypothetical protein
VYRQLSVCSESSYHLDDFEQQYIMVSYAVTHQAYLKIIFHAAKHPHLPVNGVLLGKQSESDTLVIEDAIPLLHHWTSLSPMMEVSLDLSRSYAKSLGMTLVGYYQACERLDDTALAPVGERVVGKIHEQFQDAIAFVVSCALQESIPYLCFKMTHLA